MGTQSIPLIAIEGIKGAGKREFAQLLNEQDDSFVPVQMMNDRALYSEAEENFMRISPEETIYHQFSCVQRRAENLSVAKLRRKSQQVLVEDRSLAGDYAVAQSLYRQGVIEEMPWQWYEAHWRRLDALSPRPAVLIYLTTEPAQALERIQERDRVGERTWVTFETLQREKEAYDEMIESMHRDDHPWGNMPILTCKLDCCMSTLARVLWTELQAQGINAPERTASSLAITTQR